MSEWVYTCAKALYLLAGKAHSEQIAAKCVELGEQNEQVDTAATVRDALQRFSANSAKGRKKGILPGSILDVFSSDPAKRDSVFWLTSMQNPIVLFITGQIGADDLKAKLVADGATKSVIEAVDHEKALVDEEIEGSKSVFVEEHWRSLPTKRTYGVTEAASAFCDDVNLHVKLHDGREIATPLWWYPSLLRASHSQRNTMELSFSGVHWPELDEDLSIEGMLRGWKYPDARQPGMTAE